MICWNFRKRDLSELISENLQSTNSCQRYFLISWNLINGLLLSTNEESTASSSGEVLVIQYIFRFFRKYYFNKQTIFRMEQVQILITQNSCSLLDYGKQIGVSADKRDRHMSILLQTTCSNFYTIYQGMVTIQSYWLRYRLHSDLREIKSSFTKICTSSLKLIF